MSELVLAQRQRSHSGRLRFLDQMTYGTALGGAVTMVVLLLLILGVIYHGAAPAIRQFGWTFLRTTAWGNKRGEYGVLPAIYGTLITSMIALLLALPVSLGSAIFLTKLAPRIRLPILGAGGIRWIHPRFLVTIISFLIELLAAIPSIVYGLWGIAVLIPFMQNIAQPVLARTLGATPLIGGLFSNAAATGYNLLTAGVILAIMITPIMTAIIRDVIAVAPPELEQGALGLGATWWQATRMVLGFSKMGIFGAVILGFARAIGETMAVTMVIGDAKEMESLLGPGRTITSLLASKFFDAPAPAIYAAFVLLVITTGINTVARLMIMRVAARAGRK